MNDQEQTKLERQARDIFLLALEIASPDARAAFVDGACLRDQALRLRVGNLLENHRQDSYLEAPAVEGKSPTLRVSLCDPAVGTVIGRYKLLQKIGEGGCGVVYVAEQEQPVRRRVALKIIKLGMDTRQVIARFEAERQALALMDHRISPRFWMPDRPKAAGRFLSWNWSRASPSHATATSTSLTPQVGWVCSSRSAKPSSMPTKKASSIATSNHPTSSWPTTTGCRFQKSSISASPKLSRTSA